MGQSEAYPPFVVSQSTACGFNPSSRLDFSETMTAQGHFPHLLLRLWEDGKGTGKFGVSLALQPQFSFSFHVPPSLPGYR